MIEIQSISEITKFNYYYTSRRSLDGLAMFAYEKGWASIFHKLLIPWILLFAFISAQSLVMLLYNFHIICISLTVMIYRITNLNIILFKVYQLSIEEYKTLVHFEHRKENQCLALSEKKCFIVQESFAFVLRGRIWQVNLSSLFPKMSDTELLPALGSNVRSSAAHRLEWHLYTVVFYFEDTGQRIWEAFP